MTRFFSLFLGLVLTFSLTIAEAQNFANRKEGVWVAKDFRFHTGEVMPELKLGYTTLGDPANEAVVILHGTTGTGAGMLGTAFGAELFGPGGTQADRRWFYRLLDAKQEWRRKGRYAKLNVVLYFRNSVDATFFALKKGG